MFNIVLLEPEKPDNTANIGRTCVCTGSVLHLIYPLGFNLTRKNIHHAGLDYWDRIDVRIYDNFLDFIYKNKLYKDENLISEIKVNDADNNIFYNSLKNNIYFATTKGHKIYSDISYNDGDFIIFGKESKGIPEEILSKNEDKCIRIPMAHCERSLNLSNSVSIVLYECLRQQGFNSLEKYGNLHHLQYEK